jgi:hypothetical protein
MWTVEGTQARAYHRVIDPGSDLEHLFLTVNTTDAVRYQGASFHIVFRQDTYCIRQGDVESVFGRPGKHYRESIHTSRYAWLFITETKTKMSFRFGDQGCAESVIVW